jgi:hypothetical protein
MTKDEADAPAVVCDMTGAPDTGAERLAEYSLLFEAAFVARERTSPGGIRWVLRADPGIEAWAADLAARENACCAFMTNTVSVVGEHVHWDASVIDDPAARTVLDLLFELPDRRWDSPDSLYREWNTLGVPILIQDDGVIRPATEAEALTGPCNPST